MPSKTSATESRYGYFRRVLIAVDQLGNVVLLNGVPDQTISGHVGYKAKTTSKWYWLLLEKIINSIFFFEPDHCRQSIEYDEVHPKVR